MADILANSKILLTINKKLIENVKNVSDLLKLSIWIENLENKILFPANLCENCKHGFR